MSYSVARLYSRIPAARRLLFEQAVLQRNKLTVSELELAKSLMLPQTPARNVVVFGTS